MRKGDPQAGTGSESPRAGAAPRNPPDGVLTELLRRVIEAGAKNLSAEPVRQLLSEMKLPKDALLHLLTQHLVISLEETKETLYSSVSRELKNVIERTNVADELATALTKLSLDVTMQVRFSPRDAGSPPPSTRVKVVTRDDPAPSSDTQSPDTVSPSPPSCRPANRRGQ